MNRKSSYPRGRIATPFDISQIGIITNTEQIYRAWDISNLRCIPHFYSVEQTHNKFHPVAALDIGRLFSSAIDRAMMAEYEQPRRFPRVKARVSVEIRSAENGACSRASTAEISLGGCYIETMLTMQTDTKLQMKLCAGGEQIDATARVATCYPQVGNGIEFLEMAREDQWKLAHFIAQFENK